MKITAIETFVCHACRTNWVFVRVLTDQPGLHGVGEATLEYRELTSSTCCVDFGSLEEALPKLEAEENSESEQKP